MWKSSVATCAALLTVLALGSQSRPAEAMGMPDYMDVHCLAQDTLRDYLDRAYGEARIARAELDNGNRVELFASRRGSWTLVELMPDGHGCVHAYGKGMKLDGQGFPTKHSRS